MPVCGYVVVTRPGSRDRAAEKLSRLGGCEVVRAENDDVLLLVTESAGPDAEAGLRDRVEAIPEIQTLVMSFGEIESHGPLSESP